MDGKSLFRTFPTGTNLPHNLHAEAESLSLGEGGRDFDEDEEDNDDGFDLSSISPLREKPIAVVC